MMSARGAKRKTKFASCFFALGSRRRDGHYYETASTDFALRRAGRQRAAGTNDIGPMIFIVRVANNDGQAGSSMNKERRRAERAAKNIYSRFRFIVCAPRVVENNNKKGLDSSQANCH